MRVRERIESKLNERFAPARLTVIDESSQHEGHAGWRAGGETHFRVELVSDAFAGHGRVARQRMVYDALAKELVGTIHALQLTTLTPEEDPGR
jgi:BolA protein